MTAKARSPSGLVGGRGAKIGSGRVVVRDGCAIRQAFCQLAARGTLTVERLPSLVLGRFASDITASCRLSLTTAPDSSSTGPRLGSLSEPLCQVVGADNQAVLIRNVP